MGSVCPIVKKPKIIVKQSIITSIKYTKTYSKQNKLISNKISYSTLSTKENHVQATHVTRVKGDININVKPKVFIDYKNKLPKELWILVYDCLDRADLLQAAQCCRLFKEVFNCRKVMLHLYASYPSIVPRSKWSNDYRANNPNSPKMSTIVYEGNRRLNDSNSNSNDNDINDRNIRKDNNSINNIIKTLNNHKTIQSKPYSKLRPKNEETVNANRLKANDYDNTNNNSSSLSYYDYFTNEKINLSKQSHHENNKNKSTSKSKKGIEYEKTCNKLYTSKKTYSYSVLKGSNNDNTPSFQDNTINNNNIISNLTTITFIPSIMHNDFNESIHMNII